MKDRKLNIGFDAKRYFQNRTGLGNYSRHVIDGLSELFPELRLKLFSPQKEISDLDLIFPDKGNFLAKFWRISGLVREESFRDLDVFHGLSNELPWLRTKVKTVVTVHDIIFKHLPETQHPINRWIYDFKTKRACKIADKIIATSEYTKQDISYFYSIEADKIEVVYQDCHPQFYENKKNKDVLDKFGLDEKYLLCVGTLEERKRQLLLIQAFEQSNFIGNLVLVGKKTKYFIEIANYLNSREELKKRVKLIENADFSDFPSIYAFAEAFVYPSICEGFGIPVLEAMNTETPVITTKDTVMEEVCEHAALYFEKDSLNSLVAAINTLNNNGFLSKELKEKGKERALRFRKEKNLPKLVEIYKNL